MDELILSLNAYDLGDQARIDLRLLAAERRKRVTALVGARAYIEEALQEALGDELGRVLRNYVPGQKAPASGIYVTLGGREACIVKGHRFPPTRGLWHPVRLVTERK